MQCCQPAAFMHSTHFIMAMFTSAVFRAIRFYTFWFILNLINFFLSAYFSKQLFFKFFYFLLCIVAVSVVDEKRRVECIATGRQDGQELQIHQQKYSRAASERDTVDVMVTQICICNGLLLRLWGVRHLRRRALLLALFTGAPTYASAEMCTLSGC